MKVWQMNVLNPSMVVRLVMVKILKTDVNERENELTRENINALQSMMSSG